MSFKKFEKVRRIMSKYIFVCMGTISLAPPSMTLIQDVLTAGMSKCWMDLKILYVAVLEKKWTPIPVYIISQNMF